MTKKGLGEGEWGKLERRKFDAERYKRVGQG